VDEFATIASQSSSKETVMSVTASPRPPELQRGREIHGVAATGRARNLVTGLGGRFSLELGIDLDSEAEEIERWTLAATLLGNPIATPVAMHTFRVLEKAGVRTIPDAGGREQEELVALLDEGGYARYDESTAAGLLSLAEDIANRFDGRLATLGEKITESAALERVLLTLPGWRPATVRAFLGELRGVWPGADTPLGHRPRAAARHLKLPDAYPALRSLAAASHLDFRDLEAGLVRLWLTHDLARCPGGEECPFACSEDARFRHS
jgi:hypothetical protein